MPNNPTDHQRIIRRWLIIFIVSLVLSGLTAFALETELTWLLDVWPMRENRRFVWLDTTGPRGAQGYKHPLSVSFLWIRLAGLRPLGDCDSVYRSPA